MNQALRPQPQLGEVLPGALTLGLFLLWTYSYFPEKLAYFWSSNANSALLVIIAGGLIFVSWIVGTLTDSVRNLIIEGLIDHYSTEKINWDFLFTGDQEKIALLDEYYFAYYQAKANYAIGLFLFIGYSLIFSIFLSWKTTILIACGPCLLLLVICLFDARSLRTEIKRLVKITSSPAHQGVYTRLKTSQHGVGVFALRDIPEGTNVFEGDTNGIREIDKHDIETLSPEIRKLYDDFCVWKDGKIIGPTNFNNLTPAWYLNHSEKPNVLCDAYYDFIALRAIEKDEELTADYRTYDDRKIDF